VSVREGIAKSVKDENPNRLPRKNRSTPASAVRRLDEGTRSVELRASELAMILDGIDVSKLKRVPRYQRAARTNPDNQEKVSA
jgi:uncharacterized protein (UPF0147 family)